MPSPYAALLSETLTLETITDIQKEAQIQYGTVTGTVRDAEGKAFANAAVTVTMPNSGVSTQTDEDGVFKLSAPAGASMISVTSGAQQQYQLIQPGPILVKSGEETRTALIVKDSRKQLECRAVHPLHRAELSSSWTSTATQARCLILISGMRAVPPSTAIHWISQPYGIKHILVQAAGMYH